MQIITKTVIGLFIGLVFVPTCQAEESVVERLRREGIRAKSRGDVVKMEAAGFNLVLPWGGQLLEDATKSTPSDSDTILRQGDFSDEALSELSEWCVRSREHNQIMLHMMYVAGESSVRFLSGLEGDLPKYVRTGKGARQLWPAHQYRHVVDWNGDAARWAPCPLERRYWMGFSRPQLEQVARTLNETGADGGAALELETYTFYSIYPGMSSQKKTFCFCDHCFHGFAGEADHDVAAKQRFDWLTQRGLLPKYEQSLEVRLANLIREMMGDVRKIKRDFLFGFYPYAPCWYYDGLIRGGGSSELPCLLFSGTEYDGGYMVDPPFTFFGDASTVANIGHLRRRKLPALYAGGLWTKAMDSPEAIVTAMDRMLRGADGYWVYDRPTDALYKRAAEMNRWSSAHRETPATGDIVVNSMTQAISHLAKHPQDGVTVKDGSIVAEYIGNATETVLFSTQVTSQKAYKANWLGRGALPKRDRSKGDWQSICFDPSATGTTPISPFIDRKIDMTDTDKDQRFELSFLTKSRGKSPCRFWVGQAGSNQYPAYMYYNNFMLEPGGSWKRSRIEVRNRGTSPLVLRFWTPPTDGTVWLGEIRLRPIQLRTVEIPLTPPDNAVAWGSIDWKLSPADARCEAIIVDADDGHPLLTRLNSGDNMAALGVISELEPVVLRLQVSPSAKSPVIVEQVRIRFSSVPE